MTRDQVREVLIGPIAVWAGLMTLLALTIVYAYLPGAPVKTEVAIAIGVAFSVVLMLIGATGVMPAFVGAWMQELVDLACILWALLAARPSKAERALVAGELTRTRATDEVSVTA